MQKNALTAKSALLFFAILANFRDDFNLNFFPHFLGESMPISIFLRNRLKYALTAKEVQTIMKQRLIKIDGKVRTDARFPAGFMDVIQIEKTGENFRLIYDVKGRYTIHRYIL